MFRSVGTILLIWFLYVIFTSSFTALDGALAATFHFIEVAAEASEHQFEPR
jgi:hypothetical protein